MKRALAAIACLQVSKNQGINSSHALNDDLYYSWLRIVKKLNKGIKRF